MNIGIVGAGRWGSTLATLISDAGHKVTLFCAEVDYERILRDKVVPKTGCYLELPARVEYTLQRQYINFCETVFFAVPGECLKEAWQHWWKYASDFAIAVIAVKTVYAKNGNLFLPTDLIGYDRSVYFASAAFPKGVLDNSPAIGTVYGKEELARKVQRVFPPKILRICISSDLIGGQIGSALKNVVALASGIAAGLGLDEMSRAALVTRGFKEIQEFAVAHGAKSETFAAGSSLLADFIGTAFSNSSHNFSAGRKLARGYKPGVIEAEIGTIEGFHTLEALSELDGTTKNMPIIRAVSAILLYQAKPKEEMRKLLERPLP